MKPFRKTAKKITVNGVAFHCVINEIPSNENVSFKAYPCDTKTSSFTVKFSWQGNWHFNLHKPQNCA